MVKTIEELVRTLQQGELLEHRRANVELKRNWDQDCGRKLSALANKTHETVSWLVVGVEDGGTLSGHDEDRSISIEKKISQHINQYLDPFQACKGIHSHCVKGSWIVAIELTNPGIVVRWNGKAYKAAGTTIQEMTPQEVMELTKRLPGLQDLSAQLSDSDLVRVSHFMLHENIVL